MSLIFSKKNMFTNDAGEYKHILLKASDVKYYVEKMVQLGLEKENDFSIQKYGLKFEIILYNEKATDTYIALVNEV